MEEAYFCGTSLDKSWLTHRNSCLFQIINGSHINRVDYSTIINVNPRSNLMDVFTHANKLPWLSRITKGGYILGKYMVEPWEGWQNGDMKKNIGLCPLLSHGKGKGSLTTYTLSS